MGCVLGGVRKVEEKAKRLESRLNHHYITEDITQSGSKTISFNVSDKDVSSRH
jgi:hypothetical protein